MKILQQSFACWDCLSCPDECGVKCNYLHSIASLYSLCKFLQCMHFSAEKLSSTNTVVTGMVKYIFSSLWTSVLNFFRLGCLSKISQIVWICVTCLITISFKDTDFTASGLKHVQLNHHWITLESVAVLTILVDHTCL